MKKNAAFTSAVVALFAAIICIGCVLKIPLGVVPIVLQNALCILTGVILGGFIAGAPTALFIIAGLIGLPVYAGGTSGLAVLLGPTGGFYPGYLLGAIVAGLIAGRPDIQQKKISAVTVLRVSLAMIAGMIILYIPGTIRFAQWALSNSKVPADKSAFGFTMTACVLPFIPGDIIKTVIAIPVALAVRPVLAQYRH
ncbi:biotin transporter BioY [Treponema sp.]|uniref:biotin transporter BioY n=1 Tax=Treponema sp. TaxID=166 RepID=UPI0025FDC2B9|nr:biotin transporter BioY [Treponema sp.]MCR5217248.1 biotin transporter BioY [Treponema sp.]